MKKSWLILIFLPTMAYSSGIEVNSNAKALLRSTNTWSAAQTFSSITVTGACGGCGSGSGGGGYALEPSTVNISGSSMTFNSFQVSYTSVSIPGSGGLFISPGIATASIVVASVTFPSDNIGNIDGVVIDVKGSGTVNARQTALSVVLEPGFTGNGSVTQNSAIFATNLSSTPATITNRNATGILGQGTGQGVGTNVGVIGNAALSSGMNIGVIGKAINATNSPVTNIGVLGLGANGVTNSVGGLFLLQANHNSPTALVPSAVIADNGAIAANITTFMDNGTAVFTIADGGGVSVLGASITVTSVSGVGGGISASTYTVKGNNIFYSTSTNAAITPNPRLLEGYVLCVGSVTALGTGATQVVAPSGFTSIYYPQVTELATDAEANQVNISAITATSFTIKNKSALNTKDAIWSCYCR